MRGLKTGSIALVLALALSGCAVVTKPTGVITIPRQDFLNAYALAKVIFIRQARQFQAFCEAGLVKEQARCDELAKTREAAKRLDLEVEKKLETPESEIDWAVVLKMLEFAAGLVL